jgi:hypothetical protein
MSINSGSYNALFIGERALKDASIINDNSDPKILVPTIQLCQEKYLTRLLGSSLYADLQNKIVAGTLNTDEKFLLDAYIQPTMIWSIMKESTVYMSFKYMNKGVSQQSSENSSPASLEDLQFLADKESSNFDWYSQRLIDYLCANRVLYPAYNMETDSDDTPPTKRGFTSRLYLGRSKF